MPPGTRPRECLGMPHTGWPTHARPRRRPPPSPPPPPPPMHPRLPSWRAACGTPLKLACGLEHGTLVNSAPTTPPPTPRPPDHRLVRLPVRHVAGGQAGRAEDPGQGQGDPQGGGHRLAHRLSEAGGGSLRACTVVPWGQGEEREGGPATLVHLATCRTLRWCGRACAAACHAGLQAAVLLHRVRASASVAHRLVSHVPTDAHPVALPRSPQATVRNSVDSTCFTCTFRR